MCVICGDTPSWRFSFSDGRRFTSSMPRHFAEAQARAQHRRRPNEFRATRDLPRVRQYQLRRTHRLQQVRRALVPWRIRSSA